MKLVLTICLLLLLTPPIASAQTRSQVREAEQRLSELGYWTGAIDGRLDVASRSALIAFQKWNGHLLNGKLTSDELAAILNSAPPQARETGYAHVEVDLDRQVLLLVNDDGHVRVLPVSTGSDQPFTYEGQQSIAYTARGRFLVYEKEIGWGPPPFGETFYANYISGGVAIHGSRSVPNQPASHGCIRVPMFAARELSKLLPVGTIVLVYDKISFVSGKPWVEDPKLKQAALLNAAIEYIDYVPVRKPASSELRQQPKVFANRRARSRTIRAE